MTARLSRIAALAIILAGCGPNYSPDTYASSAVQQANKVEQGVIVGVRPVAVSASGAVGAVTGGAAGGIAGAQVGTGPVSALTALGGSLVGGLAGSAAEHVAGDSKAFEYIIRKPNGDLVSVTQKDEAPLRLGLKVLVIAGTQARVVPDYTNPDAGQGAAQGAPTAPPAARPPAGVKSTPLPPAEPPAATAPQNLIPPNLAPPPATGASSGSGFGSSPATPTGVSQGATPPPHPPAPLAPPFFNPPYQSGVLPAAVGHPEQGEALPGQAAPATPPDAPK